MVKEDIIAIIPVRGGSKRIPRKNLLPLGGRPLLSYTLIQARQSRHITEVYVSTEEDEIEGVARSFGAEVIRRPAELAGDEVSSEAVLLHALDERKRRGFHDPDFIVFLQCTSPVRRSDDIDRAIETFIREGADSLFSACRNHRFLWKLQNGVPLPINYRYEDRPREQDTEGQYQENGSIYIFRPEVLRRNQNRLGGKIVIYEMDYWCSFQVDTVEDAKLIEWILRWPVYALPKDQFDLMVRSDSAPE